MTRVRLATAVTALFCLAVGFAACSDPDSGGAAEVAGETTVRSNTTSTTTPSSTTTFPSPPVSLIDPITITRPTEPVKKRDWEGQRFDFGTVKRVRKPGNDWVVDFDRAQLEENGSLNSGVTLTQEPVLVGNIDQPYVNENPRIRTFTVSPDATVLRLTPGWTCDTGTPTWDTITLAQLAFWGVGSDTQDALTFDDLGQVTRIRLSRPC